MSHHWWFDDLARAASRPLSRRDAVTAVVAAVAGTILGSSLSDSFAASRTFTVKSSLALQALGNCMAGTAAQQTCCTLCANLYPNNPQAALGCYQGKRDRSPGPCDCVASGGTPHATNPDQSASFVCCSSTQVYTNGRCLNLNTCGPNTSTDACDAPSGGNCSGDCFCYSTTEGFAQCGGHFLCNTAQANCASSSDCPSGYICAINAGGNSCCGGNINTVCIQACGPK